MSSLGYFAGILLIIIMVAGWVSDVSVSPYNH